MTDTLARFHAEYGLIDPVRYTVESGMKAIYLPTRSLVAETWINFNDFLVTHIRSVFGREWYDNQFDLPADSQLPVTRWHTHLRDLERQVPKDARGVREVAFDGPLRCLATLAYDLFLIDHHGAFSPALMARLRSRATFQSARHETSVAETMIRAGFRLEWEDESNNKQQHPEFVATEIATGLRVAVEAKSLHRHGVLGALHGVAPPTLDSVRARKEAERVCGQVALSLPKSKGLPFFIFVDLNLQTDVAHRVATEWGPHFEDILPIVDHGYDDNGVSAGFIHNLLMVTNFAAQYDAANVPASPPIAFLHHPDSSYCRFPVPHDVIARIEHGVQTYGAIPVWYPGLFDEIR